MKIFTEIALCRFFSKIKENQVKTTKKQQLHTICTAGKGSNKVLRKTSVQAVGEVLKSLQVLILHCKNTFTRVENVIEVKANYLN